jgi:hypothetical protein
LEKWVLYLDHRQSKDNLSLIYWFCYPRKAIWRRKRGRLMISIDELGRWSQVAIIKGAEPHPNADKLMVLQVDLFRAATDGAGIEITTRPNNSSADNRIVET